MTEHVIVDPDQVELRGRLFNTLKLRERLLTADTMLRPICQLWIVAALLIGGPLVHDPVKYPVHQGFILSCICFGVYYWLIGSVRRSTEVYLEKLAAMYGYDLTKGSLKTLQCQLDKEKTFKDSDDPKFVRFLFGITRFLHLPRRGLVQQTVVLAQFIFLGYYVYSYVHFFGSYTPEHFPAILWQLHAAVTLFGVFMMAKNASFLLTSRFFLALMKGAIDFKALIKKE